MSRAEDYGKRLDCENTRGIGRERRRLEKAMDIDALPPWHPDRTDIKLREAPVFLKRLYNMSVSLFALTQWAKKGYKKKSGKHVFLKVYTKRHVRYVKRRDLMAFIDEQD